MDEEIQKWKNCRLLDPEMSALLYKESVLETDFFDGRVEFGTGGMRGLIGPGPNGINEVTIARVTAGLGDLLWKEQNQAEKIKVVIGYDNRFFSRRFAEIAGAILSAKKIEVFIFDTLTPTPIVSYTIRRMGAQAGIMITASHNSKEYNGYKVYDQTGCQILPDSVAALNKESEKYQETFTFELEKQAIHWLDERYEDQYVDEFQDYISANPKELSIGYSPEQGTGGQVVKKLFDTYGFTQVTYPAEQWTPDPAFSNTKSPNPEESSAFDLLKQYGKREKLELLLATDPDADRLGAFYRTTEGEYIRLTGNQIGAILFNYLLHQSSKSTNKYLVKTIVSSDLVKKIAEDHGIEVQEVLTGFKYIGDTINRQGTENFLFAFEESFGYLIKPIVRDKDGVQIALILAEVANQLKANGQTLGDYLNNIYDQYGYFGEGAISINVSNRQGLERQQKLYEELSMIFEKQATISEDYEKQLRKALKKGIQSNIALPKAKVRKFYLEDNSWICIRPSGTEPKLKIYFGVVTDSLENTNQKVKELTNAVNQIISEIE